MQAPDFDERNLLGVCRVGKRYFEGKVRREIT